MISVHEIRVGDIWEWKFQVNSSINNCVIVVNIGTGDIIDFRSYDDLVSCLYKDVFFEYLGFCNNESYINLFNIRQIIE